MCYTASPGAKPPRPVPTSTSRPNLKKKGSSLGPGAIAGLVVGGAVVGYVCVLGADFESKELECQVSADELPVVRPGWFLTNQTPYRSHHWQKLASEATTLPVQCT